MKLYWTERNRTRAVDRLDEVVALPPDVSDAKSKTIEAAALAVGGPTARSDADAFIRAGWSFVPVASYWETKKDRINCRAVYLDDNSGRLYIDARQLTVRFVPAASQQRISKMLADHGLALKRKLAFAPNLFVVSPTNADVGGSDIVQLADEISREPEVAYASPEFVEAISGRPA